MKNLWTSRICVCVCVHIYVYFILTIGYKHRTSWEEASFVHGSPDKGPRGLSESHSFSDGDWTSGFSPATWTTYWYKELLYRATCASASTRVLSVFIHLSNLPIMILCSVSEGTNIFTLKTETNNFLWKFVFAQKTAWCPNANHNVNVECGENLNCFILVVLMKKLSHYRPEQEGCRTWRFP